VAGMSALIEKWITYILASVCAAAYLHFFAQSEFSKTINSLFTAIISISAVSIGFIATTKSILFSLRDSSTVKWIKSGGSYQSLIDYMMTAIRWCFLNAIVSAVCLLVDFPSYYWAPFLFAAWVFTCVTAFSSCYRVIHIFSKILRAQ